MLVAARKSTCFSYTTVPTSKEIWSTFFVENIVSPLAPERTASGRGSFVGSHLGGHEVPPETGPRLGFMFCCHQPDLLNRFEQRAPRSHCAQPHKHCAPSWSQGLNKQVWPAFRSPVQSAGGSPQEMSGAPLGRGPLSL